VDLGVGGEEGEGVSVVEEAGEGDEGSSGGNRWEMDQMDHDVNGMGLEAVGCGQRRCLPRETRSIQITGVRNIKHLGSGFMLPWINGCPRGRCVAFSVKGISKARAQYKGSTGRLHLSIDSRQFLPTCKFMCQFNFGISLKSPASPIQPACQTCPQP